MTKPPPPQTPYSVFIFFLYEHTARLITEPRERSLYCHLFIVNVRSSPEIAVMYKCCGSNSCIKKNGNSISSIKGTILDFFLMYFIVSDEESWKLFTELKNLHLLSRYCRLCVSFFQSWEAHDRFLPLKHNVWSSLSRQWMKIFEFCKKFSAFFIGHNKIHQKKNRV